MEKGTNDEKHTYWIYLQEFSNIIGQNLIDDKFQEVLIVISFPN